MRIFPVFEYISRDFLKYIDIFKEVTSFRVIFDRKYYENVQNRVTSPAISPLQHVHFAHLAMN